MDISDQQIEICDVAMDNKRNKLSMSVVFNKYIQMESSFVIF